MTSTINSAKQRKLSDLRVIDLQRELRSFNISFDKKELKGSLLEKLRQALVNRNIDPENHLFDISVDLKSISSDENNRNLEENGSYEANNPETFTMETDSEQPENPVQTNATSSNEIDDEQNGQNNRIDTMDLRQMVQEYDDENLILTIDQSTTKQEDENNNDKIDPHLNQLSGFSFDEELDKKNFTHPNCRNSPIEQQTSVDSNHGEELQPSTTTTTDLSNDNDNLSKSEINRQESNDEQTKKDITNKDQCHLWVSNIAKETHASDLKELFSKYGKVLTTKVIGSSSSQWFGYINLATPDDVQKCINALDQTELHGKKIYVDREMHDQPSKSKSNSSSTSLSNTHDKRSDYKSSSNSSYRKRDSITDSQKKSSTTEGNNSSKKRPASTSNENRKKLSTTDVNKSNNDERTTSSHETDSTNKKSSNETRRNSSGSTHSQSSKYHTAQKSSTNDRKSDKHSNRSEKSSTNDPSTSKTSSPTSHRSHSSEKRLNSSSNKPDHHRSSSTDKSRHHTPSNKYDKPKEKDAHRSTYQNEQRLRHEKEVLERKQYVQHQEEEKIKEQQRRLAEERERMRREFEILERERIEIERTRLALEKEKQDQARELEKQQRRLADEAKHRQQQAEAKIRDEKLHRISQNDNKRSRSSHHESQRSHHSNANNNNSSSNNSSHSNKGYDHRSSTNATSGRGRDRSLGDTNRDYYPEPKRQYNNNSNNQREQIFRDRVVYRDSDLPTSSASYGLNSSSMSSSNNNQRYLPSSSNQHRPVDPYNTLPQRGRDMALPPASSTAYERSSRNAGSPPSNPNTLIRRPHSRERFDDREYMQQAQRRGRSPPLPPPANSLRREPMESAHWERSKSRDTAHYNDDSHKYLPAQYLSESSQSTSQQQQGLWSAAPPSRQPHHHSDLPLKGVSHAPGVDSYGWQRVSQPVPPQPLPSHDRSRGNVPNNPRIPILSPNQPPPPLPSSRGSTAGQTHLYNHPGVPVNALPTSSHGSLAPPPPPLHHATAYVTQPAPPAGLVLHPTGQTRAYEPHYVVTQPLQQRRY